MRGVYYAKDGKFLYLNEQDVIDRPALRMALAQHRSHCKPAGRHTVKHTTPGEELAIFLGWELDAEEFEVVVAFLKDSGFREDVTIGSNLL